MQNSGCAHIWEEVEAGIGRSPWTHTGILVLQDWEGPSFHLVFISYIWCVYSLVSVKYYIIKKYF